MNQVKDMSLEGKQTQKDENHHHEDHESSPEGHDCGCSLDYEQQEEADFEQMISTEIKEEHAPSEEPHAENDQKTHTHNAALENFLSDLAKVSDHEEKLRTAMAFMQMSISQTGTPSFRNFWEARKQCLILFKENISPQSRVQLWNNYIELSQEAKRLKEILDEQSAFAAEQIDIAVKALENDVGLINEFIEKAPLFEFSVTPQFIEAKNPIYKNTQRELNILNAHAARINALRKELIKTEMRVRQKNKFFQRLSLIGDQVFPRRKELIKNISQQFMDDVSAFIEAYFSKDELPRSLFTFREEIKALQGMAKALTLNTQSFTYTRTKLSECWDKIKRAEKDRKRERAQQKGLYKQNVDLVQQKIQELDQAFQGGTLPVSEANQKIEDIVALMRSVELGRDELSFLRNALNQSRKMVLEKVKSEERDRHQHEQIKDREKREKIQQVKQKIDLLRENAEKTDVETLISERDALLQEVQSSAMNRLQKQEMERLLKSLKDVITEKKETVMLNLSDNDQQTLIQLKDVLKQRKERRQEIKNQLEVIRKAIGSSGFDFEKAMNYNTQMNEEKERLEKINQGIAEIEEKIEELEG